MNALVGWLVLLPLLVPGPCVAAAADAQPAAETVRVLLVRHGEVEAEGADPPLGVAGRARAACLVQKLHDERVTHLFSSSRRRAAETLAPLAAARELTVAERDPMQVGALAAELSALPAGSVAVVAGHSNTLPMLVRALGGELTGLVEEQGQLAIPREEHDRLVTLLLRLDAAPGERVASLDERRYSCGEPRR